MSRATRQEVLIRSFIEALCLTLKDKLKDQPRQKPKVEACGAILGYLEGLIDYNPLTLEPREAAKVMRVLEWFRREQGVFEELQKPEVLTAMALALAERVSVVTRNKKQVLWAHLTLQIQALYDTFDRQVQKVDLLVKGGELADQILAKEA